MIGVCLFVAVMFAGMWLWASMFDPPDDDTASIRRHQRTQRAFRRMR